MKLRHHLLVLALVALAATALGGWLYYRNVTLAGATAADRKATLELAAVKAHLSAFLAEQLKPVRLLAGMAEVRRFLDNGDDPAAVDGLLDHFQRSLGADVCYLMAGDGTTVASSNRDQPDSFVGHNFAFRPYFQRAMRGTPAIYMALGATSGKKGVYYSYPVLDEANRQPLGVAVIKAATTGIEAEFRRQEAGTLLLVDPHGLIFIANRPQWEFHTLTPLDAATEQHLAASRQFGPPPWPWTGLEQEDQRHLRQPPARRYTVYRDAVEEFPGWEMVLLKDSHAQQADYVLPVLRTTGLAVFPAFFLLAGIIFFLAQRAWTELHHRQRAEAALRESEQRYRTLYTRTPALLHSIDPSGRLVSVSDHWLAVMGYSREEVLGRPITDFLTEESRRRAETQVIPHFLAHGSCTDVPYQFVTRSGRILEVLLSAIAERDEDGAIVRSLAILVDVTALKQTQEELRRAGDQLKRYSRELERQVAERTREITSILRHSPAMIYLKDKNGRYRLANRRFAELFGLDPEGIRGRTEEELLGDNAVFAAADRSCLASGQPEQSEVEVTAAGRRHTFLAVRFPMTGAGGTVDGIGVVATDVTALKEAREKLRHLSARVVAGQEQERAAVARELHDELGQLLTALRMEAVLLAGRLTDTELAARCRAMTELIDHTIGEVRGLALRLRPGVLDDLGLAAALQWLADDFEQRTAVSCSLSVADPGVLDPTVATALYRIAQEALTNVARHAGAEHAHLELRCDDGQLLLRISDDGRGFDPGGGNEGLGITGIRERAELVGGTFSLESAPGHGTTLTVTVPRAATTPGGTS